VAKKVIVAGGGPAGMMAAIRAAQRGASVTLIEKNSSPGKKILLSGKGRCNLTNACELDLFLAKFSRNGQFLRDAFKIFFNRQLMRFFEERGLRLKIERQLRVFPQADRAQNVLEVLKKELRRQRVRLLCDCRLKDIILRENEFKAVFLAGGRLINADRLILATGGASYAFTGSTGEGIELAARLGHRVNALKPGLVGLETREKFCRALEGLVLKNIRLIFSNGKGGLVSEIGELLFTGYGISGPLVLSLSAKIVDWLYEGKSVNAKIDLKPALSVEQLNSRLLREFKNKRKSALKNILKEFLPQKMAPVFLGICAVAPDKTANQVTQRERMAIAGFFKALPLHILRSRPLEEAMVTRGGVSVRDISPRTMESRVVKGLYFAGEMIDVDADTGGFNLQAAFSTGYLAGESAAANP